MNTLYFVCAILFILGFREGDSRSVGAREYANRWLAAEQRFLDSIQNDTEREKEDKIQRYHVKRWLEGEKAYAHQLRQHSNGKKELENQPEYIKRWLEGEEAYFQSRLRESSTSSPNPYPEDEVTNKPASQSEECNNWGKVKCKSDVEIIELSKTIVGETKTWFQSIIEKIKKAIDKNINENST